MASSTKVTLRCMRSLAGIRQNCLGHFVRQQSIKSTKKAAQNSSKPSSFLGVCYISEDVLPYHRVRQLHTTSPYMFHAVPDTAYEVELERIDDTKSDDIVPATMHFEQQEKEDEIVSFGFKERQTNDVGQSYSDFNSSVFMTYHDSSAFYDPSS